MFLLLDVVCFGVWRTRGQLSYDFLVFSWVSLERLSIPLVTNTHTHNISNITYNNSTLLIMLKKNLDRKNREREREAIECEKINLDL